MILAATTTETEFSLWTLPKNKWQNPLGEIKSDDLNSDVKDISERIKSFNDRIKPFETPISLEILNKLIK